MSESRSLSMLQTARAIDALADMTISMTVEGVVPDERAFLCSCKGVGIVDGMIVRGGGGYGCNPSAAIMDYWRYLTELADDEYIKADDKYYRWNGFMWKEQHPSWKD